MGKNLLIICLSLLGAGHVFGQTTFKQISDSLPVSTSYANALFGGGVSFYDFDQDGWDDLSIATGPGDSLTFMRNNMGLYEKVSFNLPETERAKQILWVDYDNDGDPDLFVANDNAPNNLYRNDGGTLTQVTGMVGLPTSPATTWCAAFGDYDRDGWLDLYVTNYSYGTVYNFTNNLYRNTGNGSFTEVTLEAMVSDSNKYPLGVAFFDYNNDNWSDIFIGNDKMVGNVMLKNLGNGEFEDVSVASGANHPICSMNAGIGDYDNNGYLDVYVTNGPLGNLLLKNNGNETFTETAGPSGVGFYGESWGGNWADFDNDGWLDLYVSGGVSTSLYQSAAYYDNNGNGTFTEMTSGVGMDSDTLRSYCNAVGDFNNDGFPDLFISNKAPDFSEFYMNLTTSGHYLKIELEGTVSNRDAIGSRIEVYAGGNRQIRYTQCGSAFLAQNSNVEIVGLASLTTVDSVVVIWPSGHKDKLTNIAADQKIKIVEGSTAGVMPQIFVRGHNPLCPGDTAYLYSSNFPQCNWSNGDTTQWVMVTQPGNYSVITQDANGTPGWSTPLYVAGAPAVMANISAQDIDCYGNMNGSAMVNITSGTSPYAVMWSDSSQNMNRTGMGMGDYEVYITDANGCMWSDSVRIEQPTGLILSGVPTHVLCNGDATGEISIAVSGGVPGYQYQWSTGGSQSGISQLPAGTYTLWVNDANNCTSSRTYTVTEPDALVLAGGSTPQSSGPGTGTAWVVPTGGTMPYGYLWDDPAGTTMDTATGLNAGQYMVIVTDGNGCMESTTVTVGTLTSVHNMVTGTVQVWPVPAQNTLNVKIDGFSSQKGEIQIYNAQGQRVLSTTGTLDPAGQLQVAIGDLPAGSYFLQIAVEESVATVKFMK